MPLNEPAFRLTILGGSRFVNHVVACFDNFDVSNADIFLAGSQFFVAHLCGIFSRALQFFTVTTGEGEQ